MSFSISGKYSLWVLILLALLASTGALGVFWLMTDHQLKGSNSSQMTPPGHPEMGKMAGGGEVHDAQIVGMVDRLAEKLKKDPNNGPAWAMLARSYGVLGRYADAVNAYRKASELQPNDASLLADFADALAMAANGQMREEAVAAIQRALAIDPRHVKALALAGTEAYRRQDFKNALKYWRQGLQAAGNDSEWKSLLEASIRDAEQQLGRS